MGFIDTLDITGYMLDRWNADVRKDSYRDMDEFFTTFLNKKVKNVINFSNIDRTFFCDNKYPLDQLFVFFTTPVTFAYPIEPSGKLYNR